MNKNTFLNLVPYISKDASPNNDDYIYTNRLPLDNYDYDYSHSIIAYMKACGCKIHRTNWNFFGGFYIYYSKPQRYIDPEEFIETYKEGFHLSSIPYWFLWPFIILGLIVIGITITKLFA